MVAQERVGDEGHPRPGGSQEEELAGGSHGGDDTSDLGAIGGRRRRSERRKGLPRQRKKYQPKISEISNI
jgi:hypothetical protein